MAEIQFEGEQQYQRPAPAEKKSLFVRLVLATGIVSTDKQAQYVLLGIAIFFIALAFAIPLFTRVRSPALTPAEEARALTAPGMEPATR
ncbi:MAG: hypothetical protein B7W98_01060 [Parcubacteria group bacterium 20-58-5]|nr:MAG: hypothetical protein B7W98_01060 [Parcubacteria group bacterium 20-58-5]OYV63486.1 MAG: hypothetical protein B7X03_01570 [Parcubacteria group bacterium 21-58-10]HQT83178.1 hypothetical protein [Candidatus Paceibacterota bacterium]